MKKTVVILIAYIAVITAIYKGIITFSIKCNYVIDVVDKIFILSVSSIVPIVIGLFIAIGALVGMRILYGIVSVFYKIRG